MKNLGNACMAAAMVSGIVSNATVASQESASPRTLTIRIEHFDGEEFGDGRFQAFRAAPHVDWTTVEVAPSVFWDNTVSIEIASTADRAFLGRLVPDLTEVAYSEALIDRWATIGNHYARPNHLVTKLPVGGESLVWTLPLEPGADRDLLVTNASGTAVDDPRVAARFDLWSDQFRGQDRLFGRLSANRSPGHSNLSISAAPSAGFLAFVGAPVLDVEESLRSQSSGWIAEGDQAEYYMLTRVDFGPVPPGNGPESPQVVELDVPPLDANVTLDIEMFDYSDDFRSTYFPFGARPWGLTLLSADRQRAVWLSAGDPTPNAGSSTGHVDRTVDVIAPIPAGEWDVIVMAPTQIMATFNAVFASTDPIPDVPRITVAAGETATVAMDHAAVVRAYASLDERYFEGFGEVEVAAQSATGSNPADADAGSDTGDAAPQGNTPQ